MAGLKRFVTYIYSYEEKKKGDNAGFARIEIRGDDCRVEVHLRAAYIGKSTCKAYLFREDAGNLVGYPIGEMTMRNGIGDLKTAMKAAQIAGAPLDIYQVDGLIVIGGDERIFLSRWKENVAPEVSRERFRIWKPENRPSDKTPPLESTAPQNPGLSPMKSPAQKNTVPSKPRRLNNDTPMESTTQAPLHGSSQESRTTDTSRTNTQPSSAPETSRSDTQTSSAPEIFHDNAQTSSAPETSRSDIQTSPAPEASYDSSQESATPENALESSHDQPQHTQTVKNFHDSLHKPWTTIFPSRSGAPQTGKALAAPPLPTQEAAKPSDSPRAMQETTDPCDNPHHTQEAAGPSDSPRTTQEPENVSATEIPMRNIFPGYDWPSVWERLTSERPIFSPFEDRDAICIQIELKDLRELPKRYWYLGNNSFLLHGFFNYRYLVVGRTGEGRWFLGVPGIYQRQERVMAAIFGFPEFITAAVQGGRPGWEEEMQAAKLRREVGGDPVNQFGCWYRFIEE